MRPIVGALAADQQILGSQLVVKNPSTTDKRSFVGKAKERTSPNAIVGNPAIDGATLTVRAEGDNPSRKPFSFRKARPSVASRSGPAARRPAS
jgi:hypothetical protein